MPNGWTPAPFPPPYRVMVTGCGTQSYFDAGEKEKREVFLPRFRQMLAEWEELGARVVASFCDDVFQLGETSEPFWAWYLIFEVDALEVAAQMIQAAREPVDGVRLDRWIRLDLRIGRPFYAREEQA